MRDLRGERVARGLSLEKAAEATRIPLDILASLEAEPDAQLRPGSTIARWREQYVSFLQLRPVIADPIPEPGQSEEHTETTMVTGSGLRTPVGMVRALGMGVAVAVVVLLGATVTNELLREGEPPAVESPGASGGEAGQAAPVADEKPPAHSLLVRAIEPCRMLAIADGEVVHDGVIIARRSVTVEAERELSVELPDLTRVRMRYNGQALRPLGNLSAGRRLVFIDDERD
jgi:hypothetical protein